MYVGIDIGVVVLVVDVVVLELDIADIAVLEIDDVLDIFVVVVVASAIEFEPVERQRQRSVC